MDLVEVIRRIYNRQHFSFTKLLHGFWERLYLISEPPRTLDSVKASIRTAQKIQTPQATIPSQEAAFWSPKSLTMIDDHLADLLDMVGRPGHVVWGVGNSGYAGTTHFKQQKSQAIIDLLPSDRILHNGYLWKDACCDGSIAHFFVAIHHISVVLIGMHHLRDINKYLKFPKFHFYPVEMPMEPIRHRMIDDWITYHQQFAGQDVVYLVQMSAIGSWIIAQIGNRLQNAFIFDLGRALDFWADEKPPQTWDEEITSDVKEILLNFDHSHLF